MLKCLYFLLGGLFDHSDTVQEIAFRYGVDRVNADRDIMPRSRLTAQIERIREQDSFYASKQGMVVPICKIMPRSKLFTSAILYILYNYQAF